MTEQVTKGATIDPSHGEIEALFVNNPGLLEIESYLSRFNPIRVMKMAHMEIRHSAILSWLMDPTGSHGLGDHFLRAFLCEALRGHGARYPSALDVAQADLRDFDVRNEWNNIDIFVHSPRNRWAFIIENKFYSAQHSQQLRRYKEHVQDFFVAQYGAEDATKMTIRGIFLTLGEEAPDDAEYTSIRYDHICLFLRRFLDTEAYLISPEVTTFLYHYLDVLETETGMSTEQEKMEQLARQLYRSHKKVLDFVIKHGAGSAFALAAKNLFGDKPEKLVGVREVGGENLVFSGLNNSRLSFIPLSWFDVFAKNGRRWPGCENWWCGFPMIVWLELVPDRDGIKGSLFLHAEVGPLSSHDFRKGLIEDIQAVGDSEKLRIKFQSGAADQGRLYSKFVKDNRVNVVDVHDAEELVKSIGTLVGRFRVEFETISKLLPKYAHYGIER